jgi:hypothetical protein
MSKQVLSRVVVHIRLYLYLSLRALALIAAGRASMTSNQRLRKAGDSKALSPSTKGTTRALKPRRLRTSQT